MAADLGVFFTQRILEFGSLVSHLMMVIDVWISDGNHDELLLGVIMADGGRSSFVFHHFLELVPGTGLEVTCEVGLTNVEHHLPIFVLQGCLLLQVLDIAHV